MDFLCFGDVHECGRGPRFRGDNGRDKTLCHRCLRKVLSSVSHWYLHSVWRRQPIPRMQLSPVCDGKVLQQHVLPVWSLTKVPSFLFISVLQRQRHPPMCYRNSDRLCKCLTSNQKWEVVARLMRRHILAQFLLPRWCLFVCSACNGMHSFS